MMRVAVLTNFVSPFRATLMQEMQKHLTRMKVFVSTRMEPNRKWPVNWGDLDVEVQKNLTFERSWKHPKGFKDTLYIQFPYNTVPSLSRYKPDVIVSVEFGMRTLQAALFCLLFRKTKLIVWAQISESTEQARGRLRSILRRFLTNRMDAVFVNGQSGKRYLQNHFDVPEKKFFFSPITTDISAYANIPLTRPEPYCRRIVCVGQLIERKGILPFFEVLRQWCLDHPDTRQELWMAGDGPLREQLEQYKWPTNIDVRFLGNVDYEDLPELYEQAGIMAFPTLADEWGVVTVEALAAGVPVLGSLYAQSVEDMVVDNENGWTFYTDRSDTVYSAIDRALGSDVSSLNEMRSAGRQSALAMTPETVAATMMKAFEYVSNER